MAAILQAALASLPAVLALLRDNHAATNPGAPPPTDEELIAGLHEAVGSLVGKWEAWKAAHPQGPTT